MGDLLNDAQGGVNDLISDTAGKFSAALNLPDFYAVHVMNFCKGFFELKDDRDDEAKNTTFCSDRDALFHFNLTHVVQKSLPDAITLKDIHWPEKIGYGSRVLKVANMVMVILYAVGVALTGIAALAAVYSAFSDGSISVCANLVMGIVSSFVTSIWISG